MELGTIPSQVLRQDFTMVMCTYSHGHQLTCCSAPEFSYGALNSHGTYGGSSRRCITLHSPNQTDKLH